MAHVHKRSSTIGRPPRRGAPRGSRHRHAACARPPGGLANGHDDARLATAGRIAGAWFGAMDSDAGDELIAAGLLILAGPFDGDRLTAGVRRGLNERRYQEP